MKAIIPVAGAGTRLRPHTYTQPKPLIPVAGKTIISFIIEQLLEVGVDDFVFIIGHLGEKIRNYINQKFPDLKSTFVLQSERHGLGHAIWTAKDAIGNTNDIFIVLGDTIFDVDLKKMLAIDSSTLGIKKISDPRNFGVVEFDSDGIVTRVVEKPKIPKSDMALVGLYRIKEVQSLLECIAYNIDNNIQTLGEYQLTDGIQRMIENGVQFKTILVDNWFDCGKKEILLETNQMLLDRDGYASYDLPNFENTIIVHPVSIGKNCKIANSIIGPHVTIGNNTTINYSVVQNSIIGSYALIEEVVLKQSVVGSDAAIKGLSQSLNIGDNTEIDFS